jgi:chorismate mutase
MINWLMRTVASCAAFAAVLSVAPAASGQPPNPLFPLVDAAAQRLQVAEPVAASKFLDGGLIEDPTREQQVLDAVAGQATDRDIDPAYVTTVFRDQIDATTAIQYTRLAQWKFDPAVAPVDAPDLSASRSTIDGLNRTMVTEMADEWQVLHSPMCRADLDAAKVAVIHARGLDPLYRQAVDFATRNYCR